METVPETLSEYGFKEPVDELFAGKLLQGKSSVVASKECGWEPRRGYSKKKDPKFIEAFRKYSADVVENVSDIKARLELGADMALDKLMGLLEKSTDEKVITTVGFGILDRAGHSVKQQHEVTRIIKIDSEDAAALNKAFGETIDVEHSGKQGDESSATRLLTEPAGNGQASHPQEPG